MEGGFSQIHNKKSFQGTSSLQSGDDMKTVPFIWFSFRSRILKSDVSIGEKHKVDALDYRYFSLQSTGLAKFGLAQLLSRGAGPVRGG